MKYFLIFLISIILIMGFYKTRSEKQISSVLKIGSTILNIQIADDDLERTQGLSGKDGLPENTGLLFVFEQEGYYSFWMKDMNFPIDIAWLDKNKKIIHLEVDVLRESYPKSFVSKEPALYVLEVNAGFFAKNNIKIGDQTEF